LSGGAFSFGNIWVSEIIADFHGTVVKPETILNEIREMGGFITMMEITELFPKRVNLNETYTVEENNEKELYIILKNPLNGIGINGYAILKAWPQMQTLFLDIYPEGDKLVKITAKLMDVPGSLNKLTELISTQVDLHAIDAIHHEENSGVWTAYGLTKMGSLGELRMKTAEMSNIFSFNIEPLGWKENKTQ